ncbi:MAG: hypothetical protein JWR69_4066 [Pedosphaera sp.]|nr:hypothetical protein [Pedosphaera sp.]
MSQFLSRLMQIAGLVMLVFGVLFFLDGLMSLRSRAPESAWLFFVGIGLALGFTGWELRRIGLARLRRGNLEPSSSAPEAHIRKDL